MLTIEYIINAIGFVLVSLLLTLNVFTPCSSVSIVNFEHVIASCVEDSSIVFASVAFLTQEETLTGCRVFLI